VSVSELRASRASLPVCLRIQSASGREVMSSCQQRLSSSPSKCHDGDTKIGGFGSELDLGFCIKSALKEVQRCSQPVVSAAEASTSRPYQFCTCLDGQLWVSIA